MITLASMDEIAQSLCDLALTAGSTLFAGAGVGGRAGLPSWRQFVLHCAEKTEPYDPDTAYLMKRRLESGSLLNALDLFGVCPLIPDGTKLEILAAPFSRKSYDPKSLRALVSLPFNSIVTTNYDRSLHDAFALARQYSAFSAELGDPSLKQAIYNWKEPYVARIHGRAEVPRTMVVDTRGYQRTELDSDYLDFLVHVLTRSRCAFIGYSFVDPAIYRVLQVVDSRVASGFPTEHLALVPASGAELRERLARYNIRVLLYDEAAGHELVWKAIRAALDQYRAGREKPASAYPTPMAAAHRFLAVSYARAVMAPRAAPLRSIIVEGIALGLLAEHDGLTRLELAERLRRVVPLTSAEAERAIQPVADRLIQEGVIREPERQLWLVQKAENRIVPDLHKLAEGVANRLKVRLGIEATGADLNLFAQVLERLVLARGWDLAAGLASAKRSDLFDLAVPLRRALEELAGSVNQSRKDAISDAIRNMLERPDAHEAAILTRLARLSFGVEIALERGKSTLVHALTLPERIYLDASVLLPAITPGHPYRATYVAAIRRLQDAATRVGLASRVFVLEPFLNEVVSHRANAIRLVEEAALEDPRRLARFVEFNRADYTNVYVGGYSSTVGRTSKPIRFQEYLSEVAPYATEEQAAEFIRGQGVETVSGKPQDPKERDYLESFTSELQRAYAADAKIWREAKPDVLIRHEGQQLARLMRELESGARSVFVTADSRLRRLATGERLAAVAPALFSHTGLLQLVDLLVGLDAEDESLARLLWAIEARDQRDTLRGYFIDVALRRYDAALALSIPKLVDGIVTETMDAASREGIEFAEFGAGTNVKRTFEFLDRFENRFYERMAEQIRSQEQ